MTEEREPMVTAEEPPIPVTLVPPTPPPQPLDGSVPYSNVQPVWQFLLLSFCTFGWYQYFWFYLNWILLNSKLQLRVTPMARAIFSPLFVVSFYRELFSMIKPMGYALPRNPFRPAWAYCIIAWSIFLINICDHQSIVLMFLLRCLQLLLCSVIPFTLLPAVKALNFYWLNMQPERRIRTRLTGGAFTLVVIGSALWVILIAGVVVGIRDAISR